MNDTKILDLVIELRTLPESMAGDVLDMVRRFKSADGLAWQKLSRDAMSSGLKPVAKAVEVALFRMVGSTTVAATTQKFVTKDEFVINTKASAKVNISYLGGNFKSWFLDKVEQPIPGGAVCIHELTMSSADTPIITALGGEGKAETTLTEMFALMEKQGSGQTGDLLTNGYASIFYIRDVDGVLRAVDCYWDDGGWVVDAGPLVGPGEWGAGNLVFSRSSVSSDTVPA